MKDAFVSGFKFVSGGIVAMNKVREEKKIEVYPYELVPQFDGELTSDTTELVTEGVDNAGKQFNMKVEMGVSVEATWIGTTGRDTAPDVQRGEPVDLYRYADTDLYFWDTRGRHDNLRRLETVRYLWSNVSDVAEDVEKLNAENSYGLEITTHDKHITLTTNKYDGEPFSYTFQINTGDGNFTFCDDAKNLIQVDSAERVITFHNTDGCQLRLDKKNIYGYAPDSWHMEAVNDIVFECGRDMTFKVGGKFTANIQGESYTEASTVTYKSSKFTSDSPLTTCTGHLKASSLSIGGGGRSTKSGGKAEVYGALDVYGPCVFHAGISTPNITADQGKFGSINHDSHGHP